MTGQTTPSSPVEGIGKPVELPAGFDVDVTRSNFESVLHVLKDAIERADFIAFDGEFTGLFDEGLAEDFLDDLNDRYAKCARSVSKHALLQLGLSAFIWTGDRYEARTFNCYSFTKPFDGYERRFLCSSGAIDFLSQNHFDFTKWAREGVSFLPLSVRDKMLQGKETGRPRSEILPSDAGTKAFVEELRSLVTAWLLSSSAPTLDLAPANPFFRALSYQELEKLDVEGLADKPGFYVEKVDGATFKDTFLRLTRADAAAIAAHKEAVERRRVDDIQTAAGLSRVMEIVRSSGKPVVCHNGYFDCLYLIDSFVAPLPPTWPEFLALVQEWIPGGVWDTKLMARGLPGIFLGSTGLSDVYAVAVEDIGKRQIEREAGVEIPSWDHAPGFNRYRGLAGGELAHEGAFDALMTGTAFLTLARLYEAMGLDEGLRARLTTAPPIAVADPATDATATPLPPTADPSNRPSFAGGSATPMDAEEGGGALPSVRVLIPRSSRLDLHRPSIAELKNRINFMKTDFPFASLEPTAQLLPDRSHIFVLSGLSPTVKPFECLQPLRTNDIRARITLVPNQPEQGKTSAIVELMSRGSAELSAQAQAVLAASTLVRGCPGAAVMSLTEWKKMSQASAEGVGAGSEAPPPSKRRRPEVGGAAGSRAVTAGALRDGPYTAPKLSEVRAGAAVNARRSDEGSWCSIM